MNLDRTSSPRMWILWTVGALTALLGSMRVGTEKRGDDSEFDVVASEAWTPSHGLGEGGAADAGSPGTAAASRGLCASSVDVTVP